MDKPTIETEVLAECECLRDSKKLTFRQLKNKWPHCKYCNQPMKVKVEYAVPAVHPTD